MSFIVWLLFLVVATIVIIAKLQTAITKININAKKKRKNIDAMFVTVKNIQKMSLKIPNWEYFGVYFRSFFNMECFDNHQQNETCETI
jgi:hypothetical protein